MTPPNKTKGNQMSIKVAELVSNAGEKEVLAALNMVAGKDEKKISDRQAVNTQLSRMITRNFGGLLKSGEIELSGGLSTVVRKLTQAKAKEKIHNLSKTENHVNLICDKCGYYAKTTRDFLKLGRLRCPLDSTVLKTKDERGETRGRIF